MSTIQKKDILTLTDDELQNILISFGWKKYRISQVNEWLWKHGIRSIDEMSNLSLTDRQKLKDVFEMHTLALDKMQISFDGTRKYRFNLHDNLKIESVLIPVPEDERYTLCISSQAGCSLTCTFCATGRMGLLRQLTPGEIFDQYLYVNRECIEVYGKPITNIVFMGMGEPMLNYNNVVECLKVFTNEEEFGLGDRHITVSSSGYIRQLRSFMKEGLKTRLAISLHAPNQELRAKLMPVAKIYSLNELMAFIKEWEDYSHKRVSYEYTMIDNFNDSAKDAWELAKLMKNRLAHINLIPLNPIMEREDLKKSSRNRIFAFHDILKSANIPVTIRITMGDRIQAACGQLANKNILRK